LFREHELHCCFFTKNCGTKTAPKTVKVAIIVGAETRLCEKHFKNRKYRMILHKTEVFLMAVYQAKSALQLTKGGRARYASPAYHRRVKHCGCTDKSAKKTPSREAVIFLVKSVWKL